MYEETNPPDIEESVVVSTVKSCFPEIAQPRIEFHYHGGNNVFIVEEKYLFRFPSTIIPIDEQQKQVHRESSLLERLRSYLTYEIPAPEFVDAESDTPFMGYLMIPGDSLTRHFDSTNAEQQRFLGKQIGMFLSQIHEIDVRKIGLGSDGLYGPEESRY